MAIQTPTARRLLAVLALTTLAVSGCSVDSVPETGDRSPSPSPEPEPDVLEVWPDEVPLDGIFPDLPDQAFVYAESLSEFTETLYVERYAGLATATDDDFDEVLEFFRSSLPASGWTVTADFRSSTTESGYTQLLDFDGHGATGTTAITIRDRSDQTAEGRSSRRVVEIFQRIQSPIDPPGGTIQYVPMPRWWDDGVPSAPDGWRRGSVILGYGRGSVPIDATEVDSGITLEVKFSEDRVLEDEDEWDRTQAEADGLFEVAVEYYRAAMPGHGWTPVSDEDAGEEGDDGWGFRRQELVYSGYQTDLTVWVTYPHGPDLRPTNWVTVDLTFQAQVAGTG